METKRSDIFSSWLSAQEAHWDHNLTEISLVFQSWTVFHSKIYSKEQLFLWSCYQVTVLRLTSDSEHLCFTPCLLLECKLLKSWPTHQVLQDHGQQQPGPQQIGDFHFFAFIVYWAESYNWSFSCGWVIHKGSAHFGSSCKSATFSEEIRNSTCQKRKKQNKKKKHHIPKTTSVTSV